MYRKLFFIFAALSLILAGCNLPNSAASPTPLSADAIFTAAAQTVEAQLTSSAPVATIAPPPTAVPPTVEAPTQAIPPTASAPTLPPAPTIAPAATQSCDKADFVADVTISDGTEIAAGASFIKTWRVKNSGSCAWTTSYQLVFASGTQMGAPAAVSFPSAVNPGQTMDISVTMVAPSTPNTYTGNWKLRNAAGQDFSSVYVMIKVPGTSTGGGSPAFAVTSVTMSSSGACGAFTITAAITTNAAGSVTYKWIRSDGATDTLTHDPIVFTGAGTQVVSTTWSASPPGTTLWMDIYIDSPNHQQFGHATFSCP
ncbi:MAG: hypothetical protein Fur0035_21080 [Anaerolineales bacterium]